MKKQTKHIYILVGLIGLTGVGALLYQKTTTEAENTSSQEAHKKDVRQAVWEQLPDKQQKHIAWQDGKLSTITLPKGSTISDGEKIIKTDADQEVYLVDFTTDSMAIPNNTPVYADIGTLTIIGYGLVD